MAQYARFLRGVNRLVDVDASLPRRTWAPSSPGRVSCPIYARNLDKAIPNLHSPDAEERTLRIRDLDDGVGFKRLRGRLRLRVGLRAPIARVGVRPSPRRPGCTR